MSDATLGTKAVNNPGAVPNFPGTAGLVNYNAGNRLVDAINQDRGIDGGSVGAHIRRGAQPNVRYQFSSNVDGEIGVYFAKRINDPNRNVTTDLTNDDLGEVDIVENLIVWVLEDIAGGRTINVDADPPLVGVGVVIQEDEETGLPIVLHLGPYNRGRTYGFPTEDWTGGTSITLQPCYIDGGSTGAGTISASVVSDGSSWTMKNGTMLAADVTIIEYDVTGDPATFITSIEDTDTETHYKTRDSWGNFHGTESDWQLLVENETCDEASANSSMIMNWMGM